MPGFHRPYLQSIHLSEDHHYTFFGARNALPRDPAAYPLTSDAVVQIEVPPVLIQGIGLEGAHADAHHVSPMYQALQRDSTERGKAGVAEHQSASIAQQQHEAVLESVMYRVTNMPGITHLIAEDVRIKPYTASQLVERAHSYTGLTGFGAARHFRVPAPHDSPELQRLCLSDSYSF